MAGYLVYSQGKVTAISNNPRISEVWIVYVYFSIMSQSEMVVKLGGEALLHGDTGSIYPMSLSLSEALESPSPGWIHFSSQVSNKRDSGEDHLGDYRGWVWKWHASLLPHFIGQNSIKWPVYLQMSQMSEKMFNCGPGLRGETLVLVSNQFLPQL